MKGPVAEGFLDPLGETQELIDDGRANDAVERCARLIADGRGSTLTRVAYGRALLAVQRPEDAVEVLREATALSPNTAEVLLAFGEALGVCGLLPAAIGELQRAQRLAPDDPRVPFQIAKLWLAAGEADKALAALETAKSCGFEDTAGAEALEAQAQVIKTSARADAGYVKHLFNQFAVDYDQRMQGRLGYAAPAILRQLASFLLPADPKLVVLDIGCGTGLSGRAFADVSFAIDGVDLSPKMLELARQTGVYRALIEGDAEKLPEGLAGPYDVIIAADVLVYLGDLRRLFETVRERIKPKGLWLFTTEASEGLAFELGLKRRYRHSEVYLREMAAASGFEVLSLIECTTRFEAGIAVKSWACACSAG